MTYIGGLIADLSPERNYFKELNFREMFKWSRQTFGENMKLKVKYYSRELVRSYFFVRLSGNLKGTY